MASPRRFDPRRLIFPIIIVAVAVGLGVWSQQAGSERDEVVERFVRRLFIEIAAGENADVLLGRTNSDIAALVRRQIAQISEAQGGKVEFLDIEVIKGDVQPYPGSQTATHSVLVGDGAINLLGLRVACKDDSSGVTILGSWDPQNY